MRPIRIPQQNQQPPRPQQRGSSRDGRLNFAQQGEMNLRNDFNERPTVLIPQRSNSYNRMNERPYSQDEVRSALTLLKSKKEKNRIQTQLIEFQGPPLQLQKKAQSYQPQFTQYEDIVAKDDKKPMQLNEFEDLDEELIECPEGCGRKFKESAIDKHVKICRKVFQQKRKTFNMKEQRIINEDHAKIVHQQQVEEKQQQQYQQVQQKKQQKYDDMPIKGQKKPKWKLQSEQFRAALKINKGNELTKEEQIALQPEDDRILCDYCGRRFNTQAADKHIPSCKEKQKINQIKKQNTMPPLPKMNGTMNGTNNFGKQNLNNNINNNNKNNNQIKRPSPPVQKKY